MSDWVNGSSINDGSVPFDDGGGTERSPIGRSEVPTPSSAPPEEGVNTSPPVQAPSATIHQPPVPSSEVPPAPAAPPLAPEIPEDWEPAEGWEEDQYADRMREPYVDEQVDLQIPAMRGRGRGRRLVKLDEPPKSPATMTPEQRLLILDTWRRSGLPAGDFAEMVGMSKHTLYSVEEQVREGRAGRADGPAQGAEGQPPAATSPAGRS